MKAKELMVGDWITIYDIPCKYITYEVMPYMTTETIYGRIEDDFYDTSDPDDNVKPIPLTQEILEKNGFDPSTVAWWLDIHENRIRVRIDYKLFKIEGYFDYVHELQHALRLCGLNNLADNFIEKIADDCPYAKEIELCG